LTGSDTVEDTLRDPLAIYAVGAADRAGPINLQKAFDPQISQIYADLRR
jgi:hypothetical protein